MSGGRESTEFRKNNILVSHMSRFIFCIVLLLPGCAETVTLADVTGTVTYNGKPLNKPGGTIVFIGPKNTQAVGEIAPDGSYKALGVPTGTNRVAVYYPNPDAQKGKPMLQPGKFPQAPPPPAQPPFLTPMKYAAVDTSELIHEVQLGSLFDVKLTGPAIK